MGRCRVHVEYLEGLGDNQHDSDFAKATEQPMRVCMEAERGVTSTRYVSLCTTYVGTFQTAVEDHDPTDSLIKTRTIRRRLLCEC